MVRFFDMEKDYAEVCNWWVKHNWPIIDKSFLPQGFVVESDAGKQLCVVFLYQTQTKLAWLEWLTVNPFASREERKGVVDECIEYATSIASKLGLFLFTSVRRDMLKKRFESHGFTVSDDKMINMIRRP